LDGAEVEGEMEFLGEVGGVFLLVGAVASEEGGGLGEVGGLAPG
jgi:hypothetical protein